MSDNKEPLPELHEELQGLDSLTDAFCAEPGMAVVAAIGEETREAKIDKVKPFEGDLIFIRAGIGMTTATKVNDSPNMVVVK